MLPNLTKFLAFGKNVPEPTAEELASDVFMTVHRRIGRFRHNGRAKLTTWIFEIAKNRGIDYHRASSHTEVQLTDNISRESQPDDVPAPSPNSHRLDWLNEQLNQLSAEDQQLLKWRAIEIPYSEIAAWLGLTEGNARVRHKRAMQKLLSSAKGVVPVQKGGVRS